MKLLIHSITAFFVFLYALNCCALENEIYIKWLSNDTLPKPPDYQFVLGKKISSSDRNDYCKWYKNSQHDFIDQSPDKFGKEYFYGITPSECNLILYKFDYSTYDQIDLYKPILSQSRSAYGRKITEIGANFEDGADIIYTLAMFNSIKIEKNHTDNHYVYQCVVDVFVPEIDETAYPGLYEKIKLALLEHIQIDSHIGTLAKINKFKDRMQSLISDSLKSMFKKLKIEKRSAQGKHFHVLKLGDDEKTVLRTSAKSDDEFYCRVILKNPDKSTALEFIASEKVPKPSYSNKLYMSFSLILISLILSFYKILY